MLRINDIVPDFKDERIGGQAASFLWSLPGDQRQNTGASCPRTRGGLSDPVGASPLKWQGIWLHRNAGRCPQPLATRGKVRRVDIYYSRVATKLPPSCGNPGNKRLDGDSTSFHLDTQITVGDDDMQDQVWWVTGAS